jgi:hypothetical protein
VSYLGAVGDRPAHLGPSLRLGIARRVGQTEMGVSFTRAFVPSYGFGGTSDNEDLTARARMPLARRLFLNSSASLRRNEPLATATSAGFELRSLWLYGSVGYVLTDWMRVEAFTAATRQRSDQPGGRMNRYQLGLQITAAPTMRMR